MRSLKTPVYTDTDRLMWAVATNTKSKRGGRCLTSLRIFILVVLLTALTWMVGNVMWSFPYGNIVKSTVIKGGSSAMTDPTLQYFLSKGQINNLDAAAVKWCHAANSRKKIEEALQSSAHMIEADILLRGHDPKEPIMAHPPDTDGDITLLEWLREVIQSDKGIKLDFKSLLAVPASMHLLGEFKEHLQRPVWINADILHGPGGRSRPLEPHAFLESAVSARLPRMVLSLGWTTGWSQDMSNLTGYTWDMVQKMESVCKPFKEAITFPVRAALLSQSFPQLQWLLQQSERYSLTIWTGQEDKWDVEWLLPFQQNIDKSRIYYDLLDSQLDTFKKLTINS